MADSSAVAAASATGTPELDIARDVLRRAVPLGLVLIAVSAAIWRGDGALTSAFAVGIVVINLVVAAGIMTWAARISDTALMASVLGGFIVRMGIVAGLIFLVKDESWVLLPLLAFTLLGAQLGLLAWETKYVSGSLAFPGLKPDVPRGLAPQLHKEARP